MHCHLVILMTIAITVDDIAFDEESRESTKGCQGNIIEIAGGAKRETVGFCARNICVGCGCLKS